jgi:hypothetical protein
MERVSQFIYGNEVSLPLSSVKIGELFFDDSTDKINVYKKTKRGNVLIKTVETYGELYDVENLNLEPRLANTVFLNP